MTDQPLQTEFEFTLPRGYVDDEGTLHTEGRMRLATAADEIQPLKNPQVQSNSSYLTIVLLSRVVTELGSLETVDEHVIENLFVTDLEYLQTMYERVNNRGRNAVETACPDCGSVFDVDAHTGAHLSSNDDGGEGGDGTDLSTAGTADANGDEPTVELNVPDPADATTDSLEEDGTETEEMIDAGNPTE